MENTKDLYNPFIRNGSSDYPLKNDYPIKKLGKSELNRIGKWRAFMKGRRFWTETDEEILGIILRQNDGVA